MRQIDADMLKLAIVEKGQANERGKYIVGDIWELTGAEIGEVIDSQPTINPEPHWIPVTEEPIPDGEYLVTWTSEIQEKPILSIICKYSGVWDCWELQALGHQNIKILAYMPLPEPYKGVKQNAELD